MARIHFLLLTCSYINGGDRGADYYTSTGTSLAVHIIDRVYTIRRDINNHKRDAEFERGEAMSNGRAGFSNHSI